MQVTWWIDGEETELATAVKRAGHRCIETKYACYERPNYKELVPDGIVVRYGSIQFCQDFDRRSGLFYTPPVTPREYECTSYYPVFGDMLLNSDYSMYPYGELTRLKDRLYYRYGVDDCIFVRPNTGLKTFTGQIVELERYEKELKLIGFYEVPADCLVLVSKPYHIDHESRFIVVNGKVITGSYYRIDGERIDKDASDLIDVAQGFVDKANWNPNPVWCIDLCGSGGDNYVLEIGAFSYCGLYGCNRDIIVDEVSKFAVQDYNDVQCIG